MPLNKQALMRYRCIYDRIALGDYPNMATLQSTIKQVVSVDASTSTVQKDIQALKFDKALGVNASIRYHRAYGGYYFHQFNPEDVQGLRPVGVGSGNYRRSKILEKTESLAVTQLNIENLIDERNALRAEIAVLKNRGKALGHGYTIKKSEGGKSILRDKDGNIRKVSKSSGEQAWDECYAEYCRIAITLDQVKVL